MPAAPVLRRAGPADLAALHALLQRAYRGDTAARSWSHEGELPAGERITRAALAGLAAGDDRRLLVAQVDGAMVGSVLLETAAERTCSLGLLSVEPDRQGEGLGDLILAAAERHAAAELGAARITIEVLEHKARLLGFYRRRGYRPTGRTRPYPHPLPTPARFQLLEKQLA